MEIKYDRITYTKDMPCSAEICSIGRLSPHYHETSLEFVYCLEGSVNFVAGFQSGTLHKGEICSIDCEDIHYLYSDVPNTALIFHTDLSDMDIPWEKLRYIFFACESFHCFPYQQAAMREVKDIILALSMEHFTKTSDFGKCRSAVSRLMHLMIRYFNFYNYENTDDYINEELHERFYRIIQYCFENYSHKISLSQVAEHTHVNKNYLSQYIRRTPFRSFSNMLKDIRCYKAERLLLTTDMSNTEISYTCGFSDPKYLYSAFEQWWGCSPRTHRCRYHKYMSQDAVVTVYDASDSADCLRSFIIDWHIDKTLMDIR